MTLASAVACTIVTTALVGYITPIQAQNTTSIVFPPPENEWMPPSTDDVRSPCPFINTLANHGFINRSGKGVDLFGMVTELTTNFDAAPALFNKLAAGAMSLNLTYTDENSTERLDIDSLFAHNKQEHDASFVRADEYFGKEESKLVDLDLLEAFLSTGEDPDVLTADDIMNFQTERILDSRRSNPEVFLAEKQTTSFSAQATLFLAFSQDPLLESVQKNHLREFLSEERFPKGYVPRAISDPETFVPLDVIAQGTLEYETRLKFAENFQKVIAMNLTETSAGTVGAYALGALVAFFVNVAFLLMD